MHMFFLTQTRYIPDVPGIVLYTLAMQQQIYLEHYGALTYTIQAILSMKTIKIHSWCSE